MIASCAAPQSAVTGHATVFIAPCVAPPQAGSDLSKLLVSGFERTLRSGIRLDPAAAPEGAGFIVQPVVSYAHLDVVDSRFDGESVYVEWAETVAATIIVTTASRPESPVVVPIRSTSSGMQALIYNAPVDVLLDRLRGCRVDVETGTITGRDGRPAWIPDLATPIGWAWDSWRDARRALGMPTGEFVTVVRSRPDPCEDLSAYAGDWRERRRLVDSLSFAETIHDATSSTWGRLHPALRALEARGRLRDRELDAEERELLGSLCRRVAREYGDEGPFAGLWDSPRHARLYRWVVARLLDDFDEFRSA